MFLALTDIKEYWNKKKKIVLLGEWCENTSIKKNIQNYLTHDYHWNDLEKAKVDNQNLFETYLKVIKSISFSLNEIHQTNFDKKFWEILIGPWLWSFISVLYDRYQSIDTCLKKYPINETTIYQNIYVPKKFSEFYALLQNNIYNHNLYSQIIKKIDNDLSLNEIFIDYSSLQKTQSKESNKKFNKNFIKIILRKLFNKIKYYIAERKNKFWNLNMPIYYEMRNIIKNLGDIYFQYPRDLSPPIFSYKELNMGLREKKLMNFEHSNKFEQLLSSIIIQNIPIEYLEKFNFLYNYYKNFLPFKNPKIVGLRHPAEYKTELRYLSALLHSKGSKLLCCQEGGNGGARTISLPDEKIISRLCDYFLTWGWKSENKNMHKFYFTKLFWLKKYSYNQEGEIILLGGSCRRYFIAMDSGQLPSYNKIMIDYNSRLIANLNNEIFKKTIYRFHFQYKYNEVEKISSQFPNLKISLRENESHFYRLLFNSRLMVITTDYTTMKQSFLLNHPTVLLWDEKYFTTRNEAKKYYQNLQEAGILFYSPEECSRHINNIFDNPMKWWQSEKVQQAKNHYVDYFCSFSQNIENDLTTKINDIINENSN